MKKKELKKHITLIPYMLLFGVVFIVIAGYFLINADGPATFIAKPIPEPTPLQATLPTLISASDMELIVPDYLPGDWDYLNNNSGEGTLTMTFNKPGNHMVVIEVIDKRSPEMAVYAVTRENFSYTERGITWELSETQYNRAPAMKGVYKVDNTLMGELIAYPHDRFLILAYILGENDKIVKMQDLLDRLEF